MDIVSCTIHRIVKKAPKPLPINLVENPKTLGEMIRNRRVELKMLQKDLARNLGVCTDTITGWENNRSKPMKKYFLRINDFLKNKN